MSHLPRECEPGHGNQGAGRQLQEAVNAPRATGQAGQANKQGCAPSRVLPRVATYCTVSTVSTQGGEHRPATPNAAMRRREPCESTEPFPHWGAGPCVRTEEVNVRRPEDKRSRPSNSNIASTSSSAATSADKRDAAQQVQLPAGSYPPWGAALRARTEGADATSPQDETERKGSSPTCASSR